MNLPADISFHHLRFDPEHMEGWEDLLSDEERDRLHGFQIPKRRHEFILGRAAARLMLGERLGIMATDVPLRVAEDGAVDVPGTNTHISIAHSGDHAVAAAAERSLGVDIERIELRHEKLHRYILHPDETDLLDALPLDRERAPILWWALKEATLKAMRTGLRFSPRKLRLELNLDGGSAVVHVEGGHPWHACFEEWDGYYVAVAYSTW